MDSVARQIAQEALSYVQNALEPVTGTVAQNLAAIEAAAQTATDQATAAGQDAAQALAAQQATTLDVADADAAALLAQSSAGAAAVSAAIKNVLSAPSTNGGALPYEVTAISGGGGTGGTPGTYVGSGTVFPGFKWQVFVGSDGKAVPQIVNEGISTTNTPPTLVMPTIAGLTGAATPTATVAAIPAGRIYYAPSTDGSQLLGWGNNAGVIASAPFGATQSALYLKSALDAKFTAVTSQVADATSRVFSEPNVFIGKDFRTLPTSGAVATSTEVNGHKAIHVSGGSTTFYTPRSAFSASTYSVSFIVESVTRINGNNKRVLVFQTDASLTEISGTRLSSLYTATSTTPQPYAQTSQAFNASCAYVAVLVDAEDSNEIVVSSVLLASGDSATFRPTLDSDIPLVPDVQRNASSSELVHAGRNRFYDPFFVKTVPQAGNSAFYRGTGALTVLSNSRTQLQIVGGATEPPPTPVAELGGVGATITGVVYIDAWNRVSGNLRVLCRFLQSDGSTLVSFVQMGSSVTGAGSTEQRCELLPTVIPAGTAFARFYVDASGDPANSLTISRVGLYKRTIIAYRPYVPSDLPIICVDALAGAGNDSTGTGNPDKPFATIERALADMDRRDRTLVGRLMLAGVFVGGHIPLGNSNSHSQPWAKNLIVGALGGRRAVLMRGTPIAAGQWAKTAGYANIYETTAWAPPSGSSDIQAKWIFEHMTGEGLISDAERHPLHRGATYRSPSWRMRRATTGANLAATLTTLDGLTATGGFTYSGGKTYIVAPGATNPTTNGKTYYVPDNLTSTLACGVGYAALGLTGRVELENLECWYAYQGFNLDGAASYEVRNCLNVGSADEGFYFANTSGVDRNCRSIAASQDGIGWRGSVYAEDATKHRDDDYQSFHPYAGMCGDDCASPHQRVTGAMWGGLLEYSDDGGFLPALGAEWCSFGTIARKNGQMVGIEDSQTRGEGFGMRLGPDGNEGGYGTSFTGYDCISDGNPVNFGGGAPGCFMTLHRPVSMNARTIAGVAASGIGYQTVASGGTSGSLIAYDPRTLNDPTVSSGTHTFLNTVAAT